MCSSDLFAYMGQGEPGYSYPQVRNAIKITDSVMKKLGQSVYRHIIATSGITDTLGLIAEDLSNQRFESRVTLHYSLHGTLSRSLIMPINYLYPYREAVPQLRKISEASGEKVCLGMLLFKDFVPRGRGFCFTTTIGEIDEILTNIDPEHFRFSLCEFNSEQDLGNSSVVPFDAFETFKEHLLDLGYETKLFTSFGREEYAACGMLAGKSPSRVASKKWQDLLARAEELVDEAC